MKKRGIALLMTAIMLTATGCSPKGGTGELDANGKFVPKEEVGITIWSTQGTDYTPQSVYNGDVVADWLLEKTMVNVENVYGNDGGQWDTKLSKLIAADDIPAVVNCGAYQGPAHFQKLKEYGLLWELTPEMIQKYAPEVWKRTPKEYWEHMTSDGKLLGIPYMAPTMKEVLPEMDDEEFEFAKKITTSYQSDVATNPTDCFWVREDILKKFYPNAKTFDELSQLLEKKQEVIGDDLLDIPITSTEQFMKFMYDVKGLGLKENGKTVYAFGYAGGDNWLALSQFGADLCGYKGHNYTSTWNEREQKIEVPLVGDTIKQSAKLQNQMLNDGVIDSESLVHTVATLKEKILNGQYAIVPMAYAGTGDEINKQLEAAGKTFRYRPFITQVPAQSDYPAYKENTLWRQSLCLTKKLSENELYQVLNWINEQYTDEYEQVLYWGPESAGLYKETSDGKREFIDENMTKYFVNGDKTAITNPADKKGLQGNGGLFAVRPTSTSRWDPVVMYRVYSLKPTTQSGFKFSEDSVHVKNVKVFPPCQAWSPVYAAIPEVVTYWGEREQWETKFKMAMAAENTEIFEKRWQEAVDNLNSIVNVDKMEEEMTKVAKPLADALK